MKAVFLIVCQTFACIGFGINFTCIVLFRFAGGPEMVAKLFEVPNPPYSLVAFGASICFAGMIGLTLGNSFSLVLKEPEKGNRPPHS